MSDYQHKEAYHLMQYRDEKTGEIEVLWNSRDGVTPFIIQSRASNAAQHVNWERDVRDPHHVPKVGDRVFVDMTEENARADYAILVDKFWCRGSGRMTYKKMAKMKGLSRKELVTLLIKTDLEQNPGAPHVVEVTKEMHEKFAELAKSGRGGTN